MIDRRRCLIGCAATLFAGCSRPVVVKHSPEVRLYAAGRNPVALLPAYVAQRTGLFIRQGANVRFEDGGERGDPIQAVTSGQADVAAGPFEDVLRAAAAGQPLKAFALLTGSPLLAIAVPARRRVADIHHLLQLRVALPALDSPEQVFLNYNCYLAGGAPAKVRTVVAGNRDTVADLMASGRAGAAVVDGIVLRRVAQQIGDLSLLADTRTVAGVISVYGVPVYPGATLFASERWLEAYPREGHKIAAAVAAASAWMKTRRPELIAAAIPEAVRGEDTRIVTEAVREAAPLFSDTAFIPQDGVLAAQKAIAITAEVPGATQFDLRAVYTNQFLPTAAARPR